MSVGIALFCIKTLKVAFIIILRYPGTFDLWKDLEKRMYYCRRMKSHSFPQVINNKGYERILTFFSLYKHTLWSYLAIQILNRAPINLILVPVPHNQTLPCNFTAKSLHQERIGHYLSLPHPHNLLDGVGDPAILDDARKPLQILAEVTLGSQAAGWWVLEEGFQAFEDAGR